MRAWSSSCCPAKRTWDAPSKVVNGSIVPVVLLLCGVSRCEEDEASTAGRATRTRPTGFCVVLALDALWPGVTPSFRGNRRPPVKSASANAASSDLIRPRVRWMHVSSRAGKFSQQKWRSRQSAEIRESDGISRPRASLSRISHLSTMASLSRSLLRQAVAGPARFAPAAPLRARLSARALSTTPAFRAENTPGPAVTPTNRELMVPPDKADKCRC